MPRTDVWPSLQGHLQLAVSRSDRLLSGGEIRTADVTSGRLPAYINSGLPATQFMQLGCQKAGARHRRLTPCIPACRQAKLNYSFRLSAAGQLEATNGCDGRNLPVRLMGGGCPLHPET
jgi:hypothetical protein